jgi:hypothetical protein
MLSAAAQTLSSNERHLGRGGCCSLGDADPMEAALSAIKANELIRMMECVCVHAHLKKKIKSEGLPIY